MNKTALLHTTAVKSYVICSWKARFPSLPVNQNTFCSFFWCVWRPLTESLPHYVLSSELKKKKNIIWIYTNVFYPLWLKVHFFICTNNEWIKTMDPSPCASYVWMYFMKSEKNSPKTTAQELVKMLKETSTSPFTEKNLKGHQLERSHWSQT